jgi:hypothetical protein
MAWTILTEALSRIAKLAAVCVEPAMRQVVGGQQVPYPMRAGV